MHPGAAGDGEDVTAAAIIAELMRQGKRGVGRRAATRSSTTCSARWWRRRAEAGERGALQGGERGRRERGAS